MKIRATKFVDVCTGHRITNHKGGCANLHGHNYRIHITVEKLISEKGDILDELGMVADFGIITKKVLDPIKGQFDHKFLVWNKDVAMKPFLDEDSKMNLGLTVVSFNTTAENMALYILNADWNLPDGLRICKVRVEETNKCSVEVEL